MVEGIEYTQSLAIIITLYQTIGDDMEGKTEANLHDLLKFTTGLRRPPPLGFQENISIEFTSNTMATSIACFNILCLPCGLESKEEFFKTLDKSIRYSISHFGLE